MTLKLSDARIDRMKYRVQIQTKPALQVPVPTLPTPLGTIINEFLEVKPGWECYELLYPKSLAPAPQWSAKLTDNYGGRYTQDDSYRPYIQDLCTSNSIQGVEYLFSKINQHADNLQLIFELTQLTGFAITPIALAAAMRVHHEWDIQWDRLEPYYRPVAIPALFAGQTAVISVPIGQTMYVESISSQAGVGAPEPLATYEILSSRDLNNGLGLINGQPVVGAQFIQFPQNFTNLVWPGVYPIAKGDNLIFKITADPSAGVPAQVFNLIGLGERQ